MRAPRLIAITDTERAPAEVWLAALARWCELAAPGGVQVLLRDRQLPARERQRLGLALRALTRRHGQLLSLSDRLDLALLCDADAVHLAESSVSVADARAFGLRHGRGWWVSRACHDPAELVTSSADALLLSPAAEVRKGRPPLGSAGVARAARGRAGQRPALYALGGISAGNAASFLAAGADGVALIGAVLAPEGPAALLGALGIERTPR